VTDRGGRDFTLTSDVLFAFDKATLTTRARTEIARIAGVLKSAPDAETGAKVTAVSVTGYTDDVGSDSYNRGLSQRRAAAVRIALVRALGSGIRVSAAGRGEADPVASNDTERGRQANRRVQINGR
jgi:outer membrane protein OmpA-like peptidoglycan-associated protein